MDNKRTEGVMYYILIVKALQAILLVVIIAQK